MTHRLFTTLVQSQPGVLAHIAGLLSARGLNIDTLRLERTPQPGISRITFGISGSDPALANIVFQVAKIITVIEVEELSREQLPAQAVTLSAGNG